MLLVLEQCTVNDACTHSKLFVRNKTACQSINTQNTQVEQSNSGHRKVHNDSSNKINTSLEAKGLSVVAQMPFDKRTIFQSLHNCKIYFSLQEC